MIDLLGLVGKTTLFSIIYQYIENRTGVRLLALDTATKPLVE